MARFKCKHCETVVTYDLRKKSNKKYRGKKKYKSYCTSVMEKEVFMMKQ